MPALLGVEPDVVVVVAVVVPGLALPPLEPPLPVAVGAGGATIFAVDTKAGADGAVTVVVTVLMMLTVLLIACCTGSVV